MPISTWLTFLIATILLCFSPGPAALSSMSAGMKYGWRRGMWNCIGMQVSIMLSVTIIALGLGAILMASNTAFEIMKWCGALYLMWLGVQKFFEEPAFSNSAIEEIAARTEFKDTTSRGIFMQGFLVSQTNPKGSQPKATAFPPTRERQNYRLFPPNNARKINNANKIPHTKKKIFHPDFGDSPTTSPDCPFTKNR